MKPLGKETAVANYGPDRYHEEEKNGGKEGGWIQR
jgi:hypothetical protein